MRIVNLVTLAALKVFCLSVCAQDAGGVLDVEVGDEFAPAVWTWRVQVPAGVDWVVASPPFWQVQRSEDGVWRYVQGPPGRTDMVGNGLRHQYGERGWQPVVMTPASLFEWRDELSDWRVIAFPGQYRMRIRWSLRGEEQFRFTPWVEFTVPGGGNELLQESREEGDDLWLAYAKFMDTSLDTFVLNSRPVSGSNAKLQVLQSLHNNESDPVNRLLAVDGLPLALRARLNLVAAHRKFLEALAAPAGEVRGAMMSHVETAAGVAMSEGGVYARVATAYRVAALRRRGMPAWRAEAVNAWSNAHFRRVGIAFGGVRKLMEEGDSLSGAGGVQGAGAPLPKAGGG